jgi:hypothetical protein
MHAASSLSTVLGTITAMIESFLTTYNTTPHTTPTPTRPELLPPPFAGFLAYKSATLVNLRLNAPGQDYDESLRKLRVLRRFLGVMEGRWMNGRKFLAMLDEDTTPRTLKALKAA